jgi:hypothetical protein
MLDTRFRSLVLATLLLVGIGCTEGLRGVPMKEPSATGNVFASVSASEPGGLVILWNGPVVRKKDRMLPTWTTWVAGSQEELDAVWKAAAKGPVPSVDFASHVVFAGAGPGSPCHLQPIRSLDVETSGLMLLHTESIPKNHVCQDEVTPAARIVAVPRRALPTTVVFLEGYAFEVPDVPFG